MLITQEERSRVEEVVNTSSDSKGKDRPSKSTDASRIDPTTETKYQRGEDYITKGYLPINLPKSDYKRSNKSRIRLEQIFNHSTRPNMQINSPLLSKNSESGSYIQNDQIVSKSTSRVCPPLNSSGSQRNNNHGSGKKDFHSRRQTILSGILSSSPLPLLTHKPKQPSTNSKNYNGLSCSHRVNQSLDNIYIGGGREGFDQRLD